MVKTFIDLKSSYGNWIKVAICMLIMIAPVQVFGQSKDGEETTKELANHGFENVRWTENDEERIYTIENNMYKAQGVGIAKAIDIIQKLGLPENKKCKVIVTHLDVPELSLTYEPTGATDTIAERRNWSTSYELGDSWKTVKREKKKNSSRFKVDILVYPQLSFRNLVITQIYHVLFTLNPTIEVSLWQGMKLSAQVILPVYNDGYSMWYEQNRMSFVTLSQKFRLPYNIKGKAVVGIFNSDRYGFDLNLFRPFNFDNRFSLEGRLGYISVGYWEKFHFVYSTKLFRTTWTLGANFYWPKYNTEFSLKAEKYLLGEKGIKFEMTRNFRYASVGFYAEKAQYAKSNGGFRFQVLLPPYKQKRHKYIPRISTSYNMGIAYNAGNEQKYYEQYRSEPSENIMNENSFNPYFIKSELSIY